MPVSVSKDQQTVRFESEGMVLWYGTPDAPAPSGDLAAAPSDTTVTVAVQPPSESNSVQVRYRVNGGSDQTLSAALRRQDFVRKAQYFAAKFPPFRAGDRVDYVAVARAPGMQVPSPEEAAAFPSSFKVVPAIKGSRGRKLGRGRPW